MDHSSVAVVTATAKSTLPWVEKYRPKCLDDLIAHEEIRQILNKLIESNKLPHLLFHGPPGTGKNWVLPFLYIRVYIVNLGNIIVPI